MQSHFGKVLLLSAVSSSFLFLQDTKPSSQSQASDHVQTSAQPTPVQESTAVPVPEPTSGGTASRKRTTSSSANPDTLLTAGSTIVKSEPLSPEHAKRCTSSPPPPPVANKTSPASISSKSSLSPPSASKTPPYPLDPPDPKKRKVQSRKSSDALRPPPPRKSSFGSTEECNDDLTLSADDCHSITNSTARLLRPLEETETSTTAVSLSPTSSNGTAGKQSSLVLSGTASGGALPHGTSGGALPHGTSAEEVSLQHELDEFSKVMAQVSQEEAAKERQGSSSYPMMQFELPNSPYLSSLGNTTPPTSLYSSSQCYSRASGTSSLHHSSNGLPNYASMPSSVRQSSNGIGDSTYHYCGATHPHQVQGQLDSVYSQTLPSQHLQSPLAHSSQTSLVSACTNNASPFSDHTHNISLGNEHYRRLSSSMDHFSPHHLPSPHPSYGQSSAGFVYVGSSGPDWSQLPAQDGMLTRVGTHPESVAYLGGKMAPSAGSAIRNNGNLQPQMSRQYQTGYADPTDQLFPHTISYGRFTNPM